MTQEHGLHFRRFIPIIINCLEDRYGHVRFVAKDTIIQLFQYAIIPTQHFCLYTRANQSSGMLPSLRDRTSKSSYSNARLVERLLSTFSPSSTPLLLSRSMLVLQILPPYSSMLSCLFDDSIDVSEPNEPTGPLLFPRKSLSKSNTSKA